jgi:CheY-like chemotaxis protein
MEEVTDNKNEKNSDPPDLTGKRIMVVDDSEVSRRSLLQMLKRTGADLDEAIDGDEAVRLFVRHKYDLVLIDLHMPKMSGYDATKNIRDLPLLWSNSVPIISVSAENSLELRMKCKESGIDDQLVKPVAMRDLYNMIEKWLVTSSSHGTEE